jgi:endonuclease/exonuclease/phosphatase family metal-dependent hydrolase
MLQRFPVTKLLLIGLLPVASIIAYTGLQRTPTRAAVGGPAMTSGTTQPATQPTVTLVHLNMRSGIGLDDMRDLGRTADVIKRGDFITLNEVRGGYFSNQANDLGQRLTLNALFAPTERTRFRDDFGNALLTRLPIDLWMRIPLPGTQSAGHRNITLVHTRVGNVPTTVLFTHIDRVIDRAQQLAVVWQLFSNTNPPVVLMGDFNTRPDDPLLTPFRAFAADKKALTQPDTVDYIFTRGLNVLDSGVVSTNASDHPMIWATMTLP